MATNPNIREVITKEGFPYVDEAVIVYPAKTSQIARELSMMFGRTQPSPIKTGHNRVMLEWIKPEIGAKNA